MQSSLLLIHPTPTEKAPQSASGVYLLEHVLEGLAQDAEIDVVDSDLVEGVLHADRDTIQRHNHEGRGDGDLGTQAG